MRSAVKNGTAVEAPNTLAIRLFAAPRFHYGGSLDSKLQPRALSTLAYMLLHRERDISRDSIAFALWPDVSEEEAHANLRRSLYLLQRWLPARDAPWFFSNRRYVSWNEAAPYTLDVADYEAFVGQGRLSEACALYEGDLLPAVEDEWIVAERDRLRTMQLDVMRRLFSQLRNAGDLNAAIDCARKALAADPWQEDFVREIVQMRALAGDRAGAIHEYRSFEQALKREMGAVPERETTEVYERVVAAQRDEELPPIAAHAFSNNLPAQLTSLIGREDDLQALKGLLDRNRLVTIAGAGGIGKTRLALQVGADLTDRYRDGVWFVEFAPISLDAFVASAVASALHIQESHDKTLIQSVLQALSSRRALLVFDNCEHLVDAIARFANEILRSCPRVQILATSRQSLNTEGEVVYRVSPLGFPETSANLSVEEAQSYSAIALFSERAQAAQYSFTLSSENVRAVADICRRLDGIALAIELAAARVRVLTPTRLNDGLKARFRLLTGGSRTVLPRHQTLRALIDWSYDLLEETEKVLLRRLAVFGGSFSLAAATACAGAGMDELDMLGVLGSLVEKSLINTEMGEASERYHLMESTRRYLDERLEESGEREGVFRRYAQYYRDFCERADEEFHATPQSVWFQQVGQEFDNIREALLWSLNDGNDVKIGAAIAGALEEFWFNCGRFREGLLWIEHALRLAGDCVDSSHAAKLYLARAVLLWGTNKLQAAERACALYEAANDSRGLAYALRQRALTLRQNAPKEAEELCQRAAALFEQACDAGGLAMVLDTLGSILTRRGDFVEASAIHRRALQIASAAGCEYATMITLIYLSDSEFQSGDVESAVRHAEDALNRARATRMPRLLLNARCNLAFYRIMSGRFTEAAQDLAETMALLPNVQDAYSTAVVLQHVALLQAERGDASIAARLTGYIDAYFSSSGVEREATEKIGRDRLEAALRSVLSDAAYEMNLSAGAKLTEEQAVEVAHAAGEIAA